MITMRRLSYLDGGEVQVVVEHFLFTGQRQAHGGDEILLGSGDVLLQQRFL